MVSPIDSHISMEKELLEHAPVYMTKQDQKLRAMNLHYRYSVSTPSGPVCACVCVCVYGCVCVSTL